jgi:hypothetical protein
MQEINKFKLRLQNVKKDVVEYRMSMTQAKQLLKEIEGLLIQKEKPLEVVINAPAETTRIIDGGHL